MILSFKREMPWGGPTDFKAKIRSGSKTHTFRLGNRWRPGMIIHFWEENPRNKSKNPSPFFLPEGKIAKVWKECEYLEEGNKVTRNEPLCVAVEKFELKIEPLGDTMKNVELKIGDLVFDTTDLLDVVAISDGFEDHQPFIEWFWLRFQKMKITSAKGQIIHWTSNVYDKESAHFIRES